MLRACLIKFLLLLLLLPRQPVASDFTGVWWVGGKVSDLDAENHFKNLNLHISVLLIIVVACPLV